MECSVSRNLSSADAVLRDLERVELTALMFINFASRLGSELRFWNDPDPRFTVPCPLFSVDQDVESKTGQHRISKREQ